MENNNLIRADAAMETHSILGNIYGQVTQGLVLWWDLFAIIQNHQIIAISPFHLLCELVYKMLQGNKKKGEKILLPHPSCQGR